MLVSVVYPASPSTNITIVLDRSNLGNARLQGLPADVLGGDESGELFDWINSAFFFSYVRSLALLLPQQILTCIFQIIFQVPATVISKLFPPRLWLAGAAIGWGVVSTLMVVHFWPMLFRTMTNKILVDRFQFRQSYIC